MPEADAEGLGQLAGPGAELGWIAPATALAHPLDSPDRLDRPEEDGRRRADRLGDRVQ